MMTIRQRVLKVLLILGCSASTCCWGWLIAPSPSTTASGSPLHHRTIGKSSLRTVPLKASSLSQADAAFSDAARRTVKTADDSSSVYQAVFDFRDPSTIESIDRLDDAIMGGISTSSVVPGDGFAKWVGVCRTEGGGFCGFRTNPFTKPLQANGADGFYLIVRLASDVDTNRRVWKLSTRVRPDRGEMLYQAPLTFEQSSTDTWSKIKVPFDSFRLVRGPRFVADGAPLNTTGGLYQVGMTMSKFIFGGDLVPLDNFRDGFFELQIQEIGLYKDGQDVTSLQVTTPEVLTKNEAKKNRSLMLKVLAPVSKLFFSEKSQRRKQAMKLLQTNRGLSRTGAIWFGLRSRAQSYGWMSSIIKLISILTRDVVRSTLQTLLKVGLLYPVRLFRKTIQLVTAGLKKRDTADDKPAATT